MFWLSYCRNVCYEKRIYDSLEEMQIMIMDELFWCEKELWKHSVTPQGYCYDFKTILLAKFRSGFRGEFNRRSIVLWSKPYADRDPVKSIHKLTIMLVRSQNKNENRWGSKCVTAPENLTLYQTAWTKKVRKSSRFDSVEKNKQNRCIDCLVLNFMGLEYKR